LPNLTTIITTIVITTVTRKLVSTRQQARRRTLKRAQGQTHEVAFGLSTISPVQKPPVSYRFAI
jgi:hypothetical protein